MRKFLLAPTAILALALTTGCELNVGGQTVDSAKVEAQISRQLTPKLGAAPKSVSCPDSLRGEVGATLECDMVTADGADHEVKVTVTSVDGSTVDFDIKANPVRPADTTSQPTAQPSATDPAAPTVARDVLEPRIVELLTPQLGARPKYAVCPEDLRGQVGATLQCQMVDAGGLERQVLVTVSSVQGTTVNFNLKIIA